MHASLVWSLWQGLILEVATSFTAPGRRRFVEWVTGLALNVEEHTITQSLVGLNRPEDWKALENFAEYGSWHLPTLEWSTARAIAQVPESRWYGYRIWARDDTQVHRSSADVWRPCTFPACGTTPACVRCRPRSGVRRNAGPRPSGAGGCRRHAKAGVGRGPGRRGRSSSTVGGARSATRSWSACGACWDRRYRSRRWWPRWRATANASSW